MRLPAGYSARPTVVEDASAIADLLNAVSTSFIGRPASAADEVRASLLLPGLDPERDTRIVTAADGETAGYVSLYQSVPYVRADATVAVHPCHTGIGIGSALAAWAESRARMSIGLAPADARVAISQAIWSEHSAALDLLRARGYAETRYYSRMEVALEPAPAAPVCPEGIVIRTYRGHHELAAVVRAIVDAFRDHWGFVEGSFDEYLEDWKVWMETTERFDPAQWFLALDGEEIVGIATAMGASDEDPRMAHIEDLGVIRRWRRKGLGTALLLTLLGKLRQLGFERAALGVDADSLTGATRLYERVGFKPTRLSIHMEKELRRGRDLHTQTADA
jgi:mycothiol synthase